MTALKPTQTSTALVRILALPIMVGALAGCDYASKLPDAPGSLGSYNVSEKPPSVTGRGEAKRLPPPPADAFARLKAPVEDRTKQAIEAPVKRTRDEAPKVVQAPAPAPVVPVPVAPAPAPSLANALSNTPTANVAAPIDTPPLPAPVGQYDQAEQVAFAPLEFETLENSSALIAQQPIATNDFAAQTYEPVSAQAPAYAPIEAPAYQAYDSAALDTYSVSGTPTQPEVISYGSAPVQTEAYAPLQTAPLETYATAPVEAYAIAAAPTLPTQSYNASAQSVNSSPIAVLRSRLPNGAIINVHPIIGAPGVASASLARTVVSTIGTPVDEDTARSAAVAYDLRGRAERNTDGYVSVEWTLVDRSKNVIGIFPERQDGGSWKDLNDGALRAMGQRVADRIARNSALRQSTLIAAANPAPVAAPAFETFQNNDFTTVQAAPNTTFVMAPGATLAEAPTPRISPRAPTRSTAPVRVATKPVVTKPRSTEPVATPPAPVIAATPRPRVQPAPPRVVTKAPTQIIPPAPVQQIIPPAPVRVTPPPAPQVVAQAPRPTAPPPTFDTLRPRAATQQPTPAPSVVASGPRPLVFRGVRGAPGDGDQALGREVGKLLSQSGARVTATPQPGALFLTARVTKTPGANSDRIAIVWEVQEEDGTNVGQVTQENDVPRGLLDNAWGEDAYYAAQGARDGIIELLQGVGALES